MSRKSKKGFQKLESQEELADFTNLRRDSDSDLDLRDGDTRDVVYGSGGCRYSKGAAVHTIGVTSGSWNHEIVLRNCVRGGGGGERGYS